MLPDSRMKWHIMNRIDTLAHADDTRQGCTSFSDPLISACIGARLQSLLTEFSTVDTPAPLLDLLDRLERSETAETTLSG